MSSFVEKSFCRGVVPAGVPAFNFDRREQLVKMLGTSELVRIITAPSGYGKSALCASFANAKQNFKDTVWIDCMSPCFIRDLCNGEMLLKYTSSLENFNLCIFDELPHLNEREQSLFLQMIDRLTINHVNIAINSSPEARNDFLRENFNFFLNPADLLCEKGNLNSIPAFVYSRGLERSIFDSLKNHGMLRREILLYYCMILLMRGTFSDLEQFVKSRNLKKDLKFLGTSFPHLQIDFENCQFETADVSPCDIKAGFSFALQEIIKESRHKKEIDFFNCLTEILCNQGNFERATDIAKCNLTTFQRLEWAVMNTWIFSDSYQSNKIIDCLQTTPQQMGKLRDEVHACLCHAYYSIGDYKKAKDFACKILRSRKALPYLKLYACTVVLLSDEVHETFEYLDLMLEISSSQECELMQTLPFKSHKFDQEEIGFIEDFLITWFNDKLKGFVFLMQKVNEYINNELSSSMRDAICVCSNYILRKIANLGGALTSLTPALSEVFGEVEDFDFIGELVNCLIQFSFDCLRDIQLEDERAKEVLEASDYALKICETLCSEFLTFGDVELFECIEVHRSKKHEDKILTHQHQSRSYEVMTTNKLKSNSNKVFDVRINFFGGLSIEVNGTRVYSNLNRRQNSLFFLYLLARDLGREVARDNLIDFIWNGNQTSDSNRRNFYNTLSVLRDGLIKATDIEIIQRNSSGFFLDQNVCVTDLQEFEHLCNVINFNVESAIKNMMETSEKIEHFSKPLLPQITKSNNFAPIRLTYREKLIDSLIFAAMTLLERKDFRNSLWFARQAKALDRSREDTYLLIMKAQSGLNLRSSAVSTFFECKEALNEGLGISPSEDMKNLYQMVIS